MKTIHYLIPFGVLFFLFTCGSLLSGQAMTEAELSQLYLDVVENAVTIYEPLWVNDSERIPNSGFFDFRKYQNWMDEPYATIIVIPGNGMVDFCYAVLLTETDKEYFTPSRIPRATLLEHAIQSIRWCCLTSIYVENPYPYLPNTRPEFREGEYWRRVFGYRADEVGWLTMAAAKLWKQLDAETQKLVRAVMIGGAPKERLVRSWFVEQGGNQDQVKQDLSSTIGAAYLFPEHPDHERYMQALSGNGLDMVSTLQDLTCNEVADGAPVREQAKGQNLYQDYSSDHHGWCNMWYGDDMLFEGRYYVQILNALTGIPVPETFTYRGNGFDGVLEWVKVLCLPPGEPAWPHGNEYDAYYGAGLLAYAYGAVLKQDPVAAALEERAADLLQRHSRVIRQYDYHRNSEPKAAMTYLLHKYFGPRVEPLTYGDAWRRLEGTYHYRWLQNLIHHAPDKWASFAWGSISSHRNISKYYGTGLCGFVIPAQPDKPEPEPFIYCHPKSLIGDVTLTIEAGTPRQEIAQEVQYQFKRNDRELHTAGIVTDPQLDRYYSFFSFADGPCVFFTVLRAKELCRLQWSGIPLYFYVREGLTSSRRLDCETGSQALERNASYPSSWWSVEDRLGMVVIGGNRQVDVVRSVGWNWARQTEYKDQCDGVFVGAIADKPLRPGQVGADLAALIYPNTPHEALAKISQSEQIQILQFPQGWRGVLVPDGEMLGRQFLAAANLFGQEEQTITSLSTPNGAPAVSLPMVVIGHQGIFALQLKPWETFAETCELFIESLNQKSVHVRKTTATSYVLDPIERDNRAVRIRYYGKDAATLIVKDNNGKVIKEFAYTPDKNASPYFLLLDEPVTLEMQGKVTTDTIGPAVEISEVTIREDGRVTVEVLANDQSGIQTVELFCDDQSLAVKTTQPFIWSHRPGKGPHTFYAVAKDASPEHNQRTSFKRTVTVPKYTEK